MKATKRLLAGLAFAIAAHVAAAAPITTVDFELTWLNTGTWAGTGSFTGSDLDSDNLLEFVELTAFSSNLDGGYTPSLPDLSGFGDFDLLSEVWIANGESWLGFGNIAYFSWQANSLSANTSNVTVATDVAAAVPEPAAIALVGLGLIGLASLRQRRAS